MSGAPIVGKPWRARSWQRYRHHAVVDGRRVHYLDVGDGPPVLLVHGLASAWSVWYQTLPAVSEHYRVIAVDLPGFGRSDAFGRDVELTDYVDVLIGLLDGLGIEQVRLVGHSLGGVIGQHFAATHPTRTAALVLVATGLRLARGQRLMLRALVAGLEVMSWGPRPLFGAAASVATATPGLRRLLLGPLVHDPDVVPRALAADMMNGACRYPGTSAALGAGLRAVAQDGSGPIGCPTLIVAGDRDRVVPPAPQEDLAAAIPGARLEIMADVAHHPMFEQPEVFNALLFDFFDGITHADDGHA